MTSNMERDQVRPWETVDKNKLIDHPLYLKWFILSWGSAGKSRWSGKEKQTQLHTSGKKEQIAELRHVIILNK